MAIYFRNATSVVRISTRSLATVMSSPSSSNRSTALLPPSAPLVGSTEEHEGPLRPHLKLPVNPNHGLYGFFRLKTNENSHSKLRDDGQPEYIAVEPASQLNNSGTFLRLSPEHELCVDIRDGSNILLMSVFTKVDRGMHQNSGANPLKTSTRFGISYYESGMC